MRRHGDHAVHVLPAGRRHRARRDPGGDHVRARAARDVPPGEAERVRARMGAGRDLGRRLPESRSASGRRTTSRRRRSTCSSGASPSTRTSARICSSGACRCPPTTRCSSARTRSTSSTPAAPSPRRSAPRTSSAHGTSPSRSRSLYAGDARCRRCWLRSAAKSCRPRPAARPRPSCATLVRAALGRRADAGLRLATPRRVRRRGAAWTSPPPPGSPARLRARRTPRRKGSRESYGVTPTLSRSATASSASSCPGAPLAEVAAGAARERSSTGSRSRKSMRWDDDGHRFARPVRWCSRSSTARRSRARVRRSASGSSRARSTCRRPPPTPRRCVRRRRARPERAPAAHRGGARRARRLAEDPLGKLDEVVYMVEWPIVLRGDVRRAVPPPPATRDRHGHAEPPALLPARREPVRRRRGRRRCEVTVPGYDARARGSARRRGVHVRPRRRRRHRRAGAASSGGSRSSRAAARSPTRRSGSSELVEQLGGGEDAREAARLAKADQASELVREFPSSRARSAPSTRGSPAQPEAVCRAIEEHYLPDGADAAAPDDGRGPRALGGGQDRHAHRLVLARPPADGLARPVRPAPRGDRPLPARRRGRVADPHDAARRPTCASSSRSDWRATSTSRSSSSAPRARPVSRMSVPSPSSRPGSRSGRSRPCTRSTSARAASSARRPTTSRSTTPCSPRRPSSELVAAVGGQPGQDSSHDELLEWAASLAPGCRALLRRTCS